MAEWRRIQDKERLKVLRSPDKVKKEGDYRLHYDTTSREKVSIVAVIAVGCGTALLTRNPIFGLSAGTFVTIVTYYLKRKRSHEKITEV
jgi:hypothetical protein